MVVFSASHTRNAQQIFEQKLDLIISSPDKYHCVLLLCVIIALCLRKVNRGAFLEFPRHRYRTERACLFLITVSFLSSHQKPTAVEKKTKINKQTKSKQNKKTKTLKDKEMEPKGTLRAPADPKWEFREPCSDSKPFNKHGSHENTKLKINKFWLSFYIF